MAPAKVRILIVDDEAPIRSILAECLCAGGYETVAAANGREALWRLSEGSIDLVVSDILMPVMGGLELLSEIMTRHNEVGVVMLTACDDVSSAVRAMKAGALDYVLKPFQLEEVSASVARSLKLHREMLGRKQQVSQLESVVNQQARQLREVLEQLHDAWEKALDALVAALDAREHEPDSHSKRVSEYATRLAGSMGVDGELLEVIRRGAMLHDIGKIGIPDSILLKPGKLTGPEWLEMRKHPQIGFWILDGIEILKPACQIVLTHHENYDGSGYPSGLTGEHIPIGSRIFTVVDSLDAMTSDRPYRKALSYERAREEIQEGAGTQYDPLVVEHFIATSAVEWAELRAQTISNLTRPDPMFMRLFRM